MTKEDLFESSIGDRITILSNKENYYIVGYFHGVYLSKDPNGKPTTAATHNEIISYIEGIEPRLPYEIY